MSTTRRPIRLRAVPGWLTALLATSASVFIWQHTTTLAFLGTEPMLWFGAIASACFWGLILCFAVSRASTRNERARLELVTDHRTLFPHHELAAPLLVRWHYPAGFLFLALGLGATAYARFGTPTLPPELGTPQTAVRIAMTSLIWMVALPAMYLDGRSRRLAAEHHAVRRSTKLAFDAMGSMPVLVSVVMPDGTRTRFNERFVDVTGCTEEELLDHGWLHSVHEADRERFLILEQAPTDDRPFEIEYGLVGADGSNRWIRESFEPHFTTEGELAGYVATGIDITAQVENETELSERIEATTEERDRVREELEETSERARADIKTLRDQITSLTKSRDRFRERAENATDAAKSAEAKAKEARAAQREARTELKAATAEAAELKREHRTLTRTVEKLETSLERAQADADKARSKLERSERLVERSRGTAGETRRKESDFRTKINRLTSRCQELQDELDQSRDEANELRTRAYASLSEHNRDFADELRPEIESHLGIADRLRSTPLTDVQLREIESARASAGAMAALVEGALGADVANDGTDPMVRPFDLRSLVMAVSETVREQGEPRQINVDTEIAADFPPQVLGDGAMWREALHTIAGHALRVVEGGALTIRLATSGTTHSHVGVRCEIAHDSSRLSGERLQGAFAIGDATSTLDAARQRQLERAWRLIDQMGGDFRAEAESGAGFVVTFGMNLARRNDAEPTPNQTTPPETVTAVPVDPERADEGIAPGFPVNAPDRPSAGGAPRLPQELLESSLGEVVEMGTDSIRVKSGKKLDGTQQFVIEGEEGRIRVSAKVISCEKLGAKHFDTLLAFVDLDPEVRQQILQEALTHRRHSMIPMTGNER